MSTEILQETRTRMYKHANRPVPLQNIRLNFTENPYHRVIRGNTYNLRTTSSGLVRLNTHLSTPQHIQRQHLYFPPVHQSQTTQQQQQPAPIRHTPKKVNVPVSQQVLNRNLVKNQNWLNNRESTNFTSIWRILVFQNFDFEKFLKVCLQNCTNHVWTP